MTEGRGERATGTPNTFYNLASVLFHSLEGGASYDQYIQDAERAGDQELADFFIQVRDEDSMRADEAQRLIAERTLTAARTEDTVTGADTTEDLAAGVAATEGSEPDASLGRELSSDLPDIEPRAEGVTSGDARREYAVTEMPEEDITTSGKGDIPQRSMEEATSPRPEPSDDSGYEAGKGRGSSGEVGGGIASNGRDPDGGRCTPSENGRRTHGRRGAIWDTAASSTWRRAAGFLFRTSVKD